MVYEVFLYDFGELFYENDKISYQLANNCPMSLKALNSKAFPDGS